MYKLNKLTIMTSSINDFDKTLDKDSVNMNNILDAIINYKKDKTNMRLAQRKQLEFLQNAKTTNNLQEINEIKTFLFESANKKYNKQIAEIPKNIDQDIKRIHMYNLKKKFKTDSQSIMKEFKDFGYIKNFHADELLELKELHELKINSIIYMYITNYIFNEQDPIRSSDLFIRINYYLSSKLLNIQIQEKLKNDPTNTNSIIDVLQTLDKHMKYILLTFYRIYEIGINEVSILPEGKKCLDNMCKISKLNDSFLETDTILFITINKPKTDGNIAYNVLCVKRDEFLRFIQMQDTKKYPCKYNDPVTYISVPLGPKNSNIFIPYLSAIMIYKQTSKSIFYLLHNKEYTDVQTYCDDINIPVMHIATCAGDNCYRNIKNQFNT